MDNFTQACFSINLRIMAMLGMYPPDKITVCFRLKSFILFVLFVPPVAIFGTLYFLFETKFAAQFNNNSFIVAQMACQVTKCLPFIVNGLRIKRCIHHFETLHLEINEKQRTILKRCCRVCRRNTVVFLICIGVCLTLFAFRPVFMETQRFPIEVWLPYNLAYEPVLFPFVYLFIVLSVGYTALACAAIDPLIGNLTYLAAGQLLILKDNLQHLDKYAEAIVKNTINSKSRIQSCVRKSAMHRLIKQCVEHHNVILKFVSEYEKCFSPSVLFQFMGSILVICFLCLQLTKIELLSVNFITIVIFLNSALVEIYFYCYYGTVFFEELDSLNKAIYMGRWYKYDKEINKCLLVLMARSNKPLEITAGIIFEVSLQTFAMILKRSYSLLAVLKNM